MKVIKLIVKFKFELKMDQKKEYLVDIIEDTAEDLFEENPIYDTFEQSDSMATILIFVQILIQAFAMNNLTKTLYIR